MRLLVRRDNNRIAGYCRIGDFEENEECYVTDVDVEDETYLLVSKFENGNVVFHQEILDETVENEYLSDLRMRRETECFSVINRGQAWYDMNVNTDERKAELQEWYQAWLDVTETKVVPTKPEWIV